MKGKEFVISGMVGGALLLAYLGRNNPNMLKELFGKGEKLEPVHRNGNAPTEVAAQSAPDLSLDMPMAVPERKPLGDLEVPSSAYTAPVPVVPSVKTPVVPVEKAPQPEPIATPVVPRQAPATPAYQEQPEPAVAQPVDQPAQERVQGRGIPMGVQPRVILLFIVLLVTLASTMVYVTYTGSSQTINDQFNDRGAIISGGVASQAASALATNQTAQLTQLTQGAVSLPETSYVAIVDSSGRVVASSTDKGFSPDDVPRVAAISRQVSDTYEFTAQGTLISNFAVPVQGGGKALIGLRHDELDATLNRLLYTLLGVFGVGLLVAIAVAYYVARRITEPIKSLTEAAAQMSLGKLDTPINVSSRDEVGVMAQALERMRASMQLAIGRLRRRRPAKT